MPLLKPNKGESKDKFVERFTADDKMIEEFPGIEQREAIGISQWQAFGELKKDISVFEFNQAIDNNEKFVNPQWILVFPAGEHYIEKYDTNIKMGGDFFQKIEDAWFSETLSKPFIDKDHEFAESFGDILDFRWSDGLGMEFKVKFNKKGMTAIQEHEYNYISPAWGGVTDTMGNKFTKLMAISLVNFPAFEGVLPTLQSQLAASKFGDKVDIKIVLNKQESKKEYSMDTKMLAKQFDLAEEASIESIVDEVVKLIKINEDATNAVVELKKELSTAKSNEELALSKAQEMGEKLQKREDAELALEAETFVKEAIELGKLHPTQKDLMLSKYIDDKEFVIELLKGVPEADDGMKSTSKTETDKIELSKKEKDAMIAGGMDINDPEEVKAFKTANKE